MLHRPVRSVPTMSLSLPDDSTTSLCALPDSRLCWRLLPRMQQRSWPSSTMRKRVRKPSRGQVVRSLHHCSNVSHGNRAVARRLSSRLWRGLSWCRPTMLMRGIPTTARSTTPPIILCWEVDRSSSSMRRRSMQATPSRLRSSPNCAGRRACPASASSTTAMWPAAARWATFLLLRCP